MSIGSRIKNGLSLSVDSLYVVLRDKTLLWFPLMSMGMTMLTVWMFYLAAGNDKMMFIVNTQVNAVGQQSLNYGYYATVFIAYLCLHGFAVYCNTALVACAHISMTERDSKFRDGINAATRALPSLIVYSVLASTIGTLLSLLDREKHLSRIIRSVLRSGWSLLSYFVIPVIVVEKRFIVSALPRSGQIMSQTWGEALSAHFGLGWFLLLLNIPTACFFAYEYYTGVVMPFSSAIVISWLLFTLIVGTTAKNVLTVVLYLYATTGEAPKGWKAEALQNAFGTSSATPVTVATAEPAATVAAPAAAVAEPAVEIAEPVVAAPASVKKVEEEAKTAE